MSDAASDVPETVATYLRLRGLKPSSKSWKRKRRIRDDDDNAPFTPGRDPGVLGAVLDNTMAAPITFIQTIVAKRIKKQQNLSLFTVAAKTAEARRNSKWLAIRVFTLIQEGKGPNSP